MAKVTNRVVGQGKAGVSTSVVVSKVDEVKARIAKKVEASIGDTWRGTNNYYGSAYRSSYANSGNQAGAFGDVPLYFALMNENNGGILYWPVNLKEKYEWYRYFYRVDPYVGSAIDLNIELPLSKVILKMPKMKDEKLRERIRRKYQTMCDKLKLFEKLSSVLLEYNIIGNVFIFFEYNESSKIYDKMIVLPPEEVNVTRYPFSDHSRIEYNPEVAMAIINKLKATVSDLSSIADMPPDMVDEADRKAIKAIPKDLVKHIIEHGTIVLDTDPYTGDGTSKIGSYVYHLARHRSEYMDLGVSILERILVPLLCKENYRYTQLSLASRNMTPRNKISAPGISAADLEALREQIDLSMLDPDYSVVTNYEWAWEIIGADRRLINLATEYETIESQIFAGLGVSREILTGEGQYSGGRINVEILNTRYMLCREILVNMIEQNVFRPVADENGFYQDDEDGNREYFYPKLTFNRLSIRDNSEVFGNLFQLYQKGSLPVDVLFDLLNIDSTEIAEKLKEDMFTPKDSTYNDMMREIYSSVGRELVEKTNLFDLIVSDLSGPNNEKIVLKPQPAEGGGTQPAFTASDDSDATNSDADPKNAEDLNTKLAEWNQQQQQDKGATAP